MVRLSRSPMKAKVQKVFLLAWFEFPVLLLCFVCFDTLVFGLRAEDWLISLCKYISIYSCSFLSKAFLLSIWLQSSRTSNRRSYFISSLFSAFIWLTWCTIVWFTLSLHEKRIRFWVSRLTVDDQLITILSITRWKTAQNFY